MTENIQTRTPNDKYSVEFFHIYTDETIGLQHTKSIDYLKTVRDVWNIEMDLVLLVDDYNPTNHILETQEVLDYLAENKAMPDYFAYESAMCRYAEELVQSISSNKIKKSYISYIEKNNKYPCSLLTTVWYLVRLGVFDSAKVINSTKDAGGFSSAQRLINILPAEYRVIEEKVHKILQNSPHRKYSQNIQALFYDAATQRELDLF